MNAAAQRKVDLHRWDLPPKRAVDIQRELVDRLQLTWDAPEIEMVAGVDVHFEDDKPLAAICVFSFPELEPVESVRVKVDHEFPYVPGLLAFREGPAVLGAWDRLEMEPDLVMFDAHGIAHPRGLGLASQLGIWLERPAIGVAKSRLFGHHDPPGTQKGSRTPLYVEDEDQTVIGAVVRTRTDVKPVYVSPGHLIDVDAAVELTLACTPRYRLPEPTRWAHRVADGARFNP